MHSMFNGCTELISLDLSNFDTSSVTTMETMFNECSKLISLDLSNFNTSIVNKMGSMFNGCKSLRFLNLSYFNTSSVTEMNSMFYGCKSLSSLNLSFFDTSSVTTMNSMFMACIELNSLDLTNFDTPQVEDINSMFFGCKSLISLDLSNFNTSRLTKMSKTFNGCSELIYLDLSSFNTLKVRNMDCIFLNCEKLHYINLKYAKFDFPEECSKNFPKLTVCGEDENWKNIFNLSQEKYINCINNIPSLIIYDNRNKIKCFKNDINIDIPCKICGNNYFKVGNTVDNNYTYCYEYKEGCYFDIEELIYKSCYFSCKKCNINGNETEHNFIECKEDYIIEYNLSTYKNCYRDNKSDSEIEITNRTELIQNIINSLFNKFIKSGNDEKIALNNLTIVIASANNQKNNENMIIIDLCKCENILKSEYNISNYDSLYILKIISEEEGMKIPKVEYEVYYPFYNNNLKKLNLSLCKGTKIEISIPVKINDTLDKYNPKSDYYNNICYKATSRIWD